MPFVEFCELKRKDGLPVDLWLRQHERPLITNYLLFPTKTNFKITMCLLCTFYVPQKQSFKKKVIINYEHNCEHFKKVLYSFIN